MIHEVLPDSQENGESSASEMNVSDPTELLAPLSPSAQSSLRAKVERLQTKAEDDLTKLAESGITPLPPDQRRRLMLEMITRRRK